MKAASPKISKSVTISKPTIPEIKKKSSPKSAVEPLLAEAKKYKSAEEFAKANRVTSESIIPKEGESFEFSYVRNTDKAPRKGARFGQDIEPAGKYMTVGKLKESRPNMETGNIRFDNPLVIDFGDGYGKASNWKNVLSEKFEGKTGKELSKAIQDAGYDGIITVSEVGGKRYTSEVIALAVKKSQLTDIWQRANKKVK